MSKYYTIAKNWISVSDEEVRAFKIYLSSSLKGSVDLNIDECTICCRNEWHLGTIIDLYICEKRGEPEKYHFGIDKEDRIYDLNH